MDLPLLLIFGLAAYLIGGCLTLVLLSCRDPALGVDPTDTIGQLQLLFWPVSVGLWLFFRLPASQQHPALPSADPVQEEAEVPIGCTGTAVGELRPWGRVEIAGRRYEARAEQGFLSAGQLVTVVGRNGQGLRVLPLPAPHDSGENG